MYIDVAVVLFGVSAFFPGLRKPAPVPNQKIRTRHDSESARARLARTARARARSWLVVDLDGAKKKIVVMCFGIAGVNNILPSTAFSFFTELIYMNNFCSSRDFFSNIFLCAVYVAL